jgi:glycine/D-amino acid oxidase-like deaminating enzyme
MLRAVERALDIGIVGYGTAGQAAAVFLSRGGHRVRVFERAPALGPVNCGSATIARAAWLACCQSDICLTKTGAVTA